MSQQQKTVQDYDKQLKEARKKIEQNATWRKAQGKS